MTMVSRKRTCSGFTLLEMMIVVIMVSVALIPLYQWQSFVMEALQTQNDATEMLRDISRAVRWVERDVASATQILPTNSPVGEIPPGFQPSTEKRLVLRQAAFELSGKFNQPEFLIVYELAEPPSVSMGTGGQVLTRSVYDSQGKQIGVAQVIATNVYSLEYQYENPHRVEMDLRLTIMRREKSQSLQVSTAAAMMVN